MIFENIKRLCTERNVSIAALEREVHIGNGAIAKWNESSPRIDNIKKVADYFGVTVDELLKVGGAE